MFHSKINKSTTKILRIKLIKNTYVDDINRAKKDEKKYHKNYGLIPFLMKRQNQD